MNPYIQITYEHNRRSWILQVNHAMWTWYLYACATRVEQQRQIGHIQVIVWHQNGYIYFGKFIFRNFFIISSNQIINNIYLLLKNWSFSSVKFMYHCFPLMNRSHLNRHVWFGWIRDLISIVSLPSSLATIAVSLVAFIWPPVVSAQTWV
jgi:hypothetical protein